VLYKQADKQFCDDSVLDKKWKKRKEKKVHFSSGMLFGLWVIFDSKL